MSKIYCDTMTGLNKESFNGVKLYHGFNAFFVSKSYITCFNELMKCPHYQICTSTKHLGMMGVTVEGDILMASSYDLFSGIDRDNDCRRYFDEKDMDSIVYDYNDLELHEDDPEENNEIVVTNTKITGIWVTTDAPNNLKALAQDLAEKYNLPMIPVGESIFA